MVPMPAAIVLIVCRVVSGGPEDPNAGYTKHQMLDWDYAEAKMHCRRQEVQMYDPSVDQGADPKPFTMMDCWRSGFLMGSQWDAQHPNSKYRFWKVACPVAVVRKNQDGSEDIVGWKMPDCGHRETVVCEADTEI
jgi:hypothetical protein